MLRAHRPQNWFMELSHGTAIYARMGKEEDERLRETVAAELERRRKVAREAEQRSAEQSVGNAEETTKPCEALQRRSRGR